jgi:hypothetical protein
MFAVWHLDPREGVRFAPLKSQMFEPVEHEDGIFGCAVFRLGLAALSICFEAIPIVPTWPDLGTT